MPSKKRTYQLFEQGARTLAQVQTALASLKAQGWEIAGFTQGTNGYAVLAYQDV